MYGKVVFNKRDPGASPTHIDVEMMHSKNFNDSSIIIIEERDEGESPKCGEIPELSEGLSLSVTHPNVPKWSKQLEPKLMKTFIQSAGDGKIFWKHKYRRCLDDNARYQPKEVLLQMIFDAENGDPVKIIWGTGSRQQIEWETVKLIAWGLHTPTYTAMAQRTLIEEKTCLSIVSNHTILDLQSQDTEVVEMWVKGLRHLLNQSDEEADKLSEQLRKHPPVTKKRQKKSKQSAAKQRTDRTESLILLQKDLFVLTTTTVFRDLEEQYYPITEEMKAEFNPVDMYKLALEEDIKWRDWKPWLAEKITDRLTGKIIDRRPELDDDDFFSPSDAEIVTDMLSFYIEDDLQWAEGEQMFKIIMSFLTRTEPSKTNSCKHPETSKDEASIMGIILSISYVSVYLFRIGLITVLFGYISCNVNNMTTFGNLDRIPTHGIVHVTDDFFANATNSTNVTCEIPWSKDEYYFVTGTTYEFVNQPGNPCTPHCEFGLYLCDSDTKDVNGENELFAGDYKRPSLLHTWINWFIAILREVLVWIVFPHMLYTRMNHMFASSPDFCCMSLANVKYILATLPMKSLYTAVIFVLFGFPLAYYFDITLGIACEWIAEEVYECPPDLYSFYYAAYGYLLLALLTVFALSFFINGKREILSIEHIGVLVVLIEVVTAIFAVVFAISNRSAIIRVLMSSTQADTSIWDSPRTPLEDFPVLNVIFQMQFWTFVIMFLFSIFSQRTIFINMRKANVYADGVDLYMGLGVLVICMCWAVPLFLFCCIFVCSCCSCLSTGSTDSDTGETEPVEDDGDESACSCKCFCEALMCLVWLCK